jgi:hypothetical protein
LKRVAGKAYVGFAYLNVPQQFQMTTQLANPTRFVASRRLNPTYDQSLELTKKKLWPYDSYMAAIASAWNQALISRQRGGYCRWCPMKEFMILSEA